MSFKNLSSFLLLSFSLFFISSCSSSYKGLHTKSLLSYKEGECQKEIYTLLDQSPLLKGHFVGFSLYDEEKKSFLCNYNADKYFNAASNTKLLTFYTSLKILGDQIPAARYIENEKEFIFWGTGDPSTLNPILTSSYLIDFLNQKKKKIYYASNPLDNLKFYGNGWMYDDYNQTYQVEKSALPLFGNRIRTHLEDSGLLKIYPYYFTTYFVKGNDRFSTKKIKRDINSNVFTHPAFLALGFKQNIPFQTTNPSVIKDLLEPHIDSPIETLSMEMPVEAATLYGMPSDVLYKIMLTESDNFIAEQLLLLCSSVVFNKLDTDAIIAYAQKKFFNNSPSYLQWQDGSGLSRYNLFTPRSLVYVLLEIKKIKDENTLKHLFPLGSLTGTLKNLYKEPFVWAKTGTIKNNYNQSGYMVTKKGKRFIFSFMNNNFSTTSEPVKKEMVRIISQLHENL